MPETTIQMICSGPNDRLVRGPQKSLTHIDLAQCRNGVSSGIYCI